MGHPRPTAVLLRGGLLLAGCAGAVPLTAAVVGPPMGAVLGPLRGRGPGALATMPFETLVLGGCALAVLAAVAWLALVSACTALVATARVLAPGAVAGRSGLHRGLGALGDLTDRCTPLAVRAVVTSLTVGVGVTVAVGPALADTSGSPGPPPRSPAAALTGLPLPDRTTGAAARPASWQDRSALVVRSGDSLWSLAERRLPDGSSDRAVTHGWHRLYAVNADRVGPDPDLLHPGTRLVVPPGLADGRLVDPHQTAAHLAEDPAPDTSPHREERP